MSRGTLVRIKGSTMEGNIVQLGNNGMVRVSVTKNYNAFARTVYHVSELEEVVNG